MKLIDMHPAEVTLTDGSRHHRVRVSITHSRLRVWAEVGRQPQLLVDAPHVGVRLATRYPVVGRPISVPTPAGEVLVTRMQGCGCGSVLKALRPPTDD